MLERKMTKCCPLILSLSSKLFPMEVDSMIYEFEYKTLAFEGQTLISSVGARKQSSEKVKVAIIRRS